MKEDRVGALAVVAVIVVVQPAKNSWSGRLT